MVLLLALTSFSFLESMEYSAHGKKDYDQSQDNKQNSNCEAGEDNNNSCNNISISRHDGAGGGAYRMAMTEEMRFKYLNKTQTARQEKITTIHAIT